jgi:protein SCO1/2
MKFRQLCVALACALAVPAEPTTVAVAQSVSDASVYDLDETWTRQDGTSVPFGSLRGRVVVAAMGYTTCKQLCPAVVADMMWLDKHLPPTMKDKVQFVFLSFDGIADTPERLNLYAESHGLDLAHWSLFEAKEDTVRELAAALGVGFRPDEAAGFDHTAAISVIAPDGRILYQQNGVAPDPTELLAKIVESVSEGRN